MENSVLAILKTNDCVISTEISKMSEYDYFQIQHLFSSIEGAIVVSCLTGRITKEQAVFIHEQAQNCLSYYVNNKWSITLHFGAFDENP